MVKKKISKKNDESKTKTVEENNEQEETDNMEASNEQTPEVADDSETNGKHEAEEEDEVMSFTEMGIDDRILLALIELNWSEPTPIQETAIPLVLSGRDILAKARTGSGKTGAYAIPLLQKILNVKKRNALTASSATIQTRALVITPSRELCAQAARNLSELVRFCQRDVTMVDLSTTQMSFLAQRQCLLTRPDVVIATPAKILAHLKV